MAPNRSPHPWDSGELRCEVGLRCVAPDIALHLLEDGVLQVEHLHHVGRVAVHHRVAPTLWAALRAGQQRQPMGAHPVTAQGQ